MIIYFNPECSKCNAARNLLEHQGCEITIRNYLENPPDWKELKDLTSLLGCSAEDLVRKSDDLFAEMDQSSLKTEDDWLQLLVSNPSLLQRPIVIDGKTAVIGRPPELVLTLLGDAKK